MHRFRPGRSVAGAALAIILSLPAAAFAMPQKGQPAPPFAVTTTTGQRVTNATYRGQVLVLDFFATWCEPCRRSIPHVVALYRKLGRQGLQVLGMSVDDGGADVVKDFVRESRIPYPVAVTDADLQSDYGLRSVPMIFVIDKRGIVAERYLGFNDEIGRDMENLIRKLLAQ